MNPNLVSVLAIVLMANVLAAVAAVPPYVYGEGYPVEGKATSGDPVALF